MTLDCRMQIKNVRQRNITRSHVFDFHKILMIVQICALNTQLVMAFTMKPSTSDTLQC